MVPNRATERVTGMSKDKVEAVERALAVLNAFHADKPTMTLGEIASATGFYKSTILRLAGSLERLGLVEATGETASFYIREGQSRVCLFRHNSPQSARHHLDEGAELPLNAGASAHVLLAFSNGAKGPKAKAVQQRGYYISLGERDPQVAAVAVPVFDLAGEFRGALAISGLIGRFKEKARQAALAELSASADRLRIMLPARE